MKRHRTLFRTWLQRWQRRALPDSGKPLQYCRRTIDQHVQFLTHYRHAHIDIFDGCEDIGDKVAVQMLRCSGDRSPHHQRLHRYSEKLERAGAFGFGSRRNYGKLLTHEMISMIWWPVVQSATRDAPAWSASLAATSATADPANQRRYHRIG